eukprot:7094024-Pyramimonas_sp.AAC.1
MADLPDDPLLLLIAWKCGGHNPIEASTQLCMACLPCGRWFQSVGVTTGLWQQRQFTSDLRVVLKPTALVVVTR